LENELENLENALDEACRILVELKYCPAEYLYLYNKVNTWSCKHEGPSEDAVKKKK
jgi:hypothetical protein